MIALAGLVILLVMLAIGFPVTFAMGIIGTAGILMSPDLGLGLIPERMHSFTDSFVFTAIPMFIRPGALMDRSGIMMFNALVFLVAARIIEPIPAMVIFVPVLAPVAVKLGIDMVYFGTIIIAALGIGMFIPPIGMGVILACSIGKVPVEETMRPLAPFIGMLLVGLVILILFPQITTFLPNLLMR